VNVNEDKIERGRGSEWRYVEKTLLGVHDSSVSSKKTIRKEETKKALWVVVYGGMA